MDRDWPRVRDQRGHGHGRRQYPSRSAPRPPPVPGLHPANWTPRELRHSFVSLLSDAGVSLEERLVGHSGTNVTELVYRHQIRPVIQTGATIMDRFFGQATRVRSHPVSHSEGRWSLASHSQMCADQAFCGRVDRI